MSSCISYGPEALKSKPRVRRSRTPGASIQSRARGYTEESVPPTPTDEGGELESGEARFNPPPRRQLSGDSSLTDEEAEEHEEAACQADLRTSLPEVEALKAAAIRHLAALEQSSTVAERGQALDLASSCPNAYRNLGLPVASVLSEEEDCLDDERVRECLMKKRRCDYFNMQNQLVSLIMTLSGVLTSFADKAERKGALAATFSVLNRWLLDRRVCMAALAEGPLFLLGTHIPLWRHQDSLHQILYIHVDLCRIFTSATRAPFLMTYESANLDEVLEGEEASSSTNAHISHQTLLHQPTTAAVQHSLSTRLAGCVLTELRRAAAAVAAESPDSAVAAKSGQSDDSDHPQSMQDLHHFIKEVTPDDWRSFSSHVPKAPAREQPELDADESLAKPMRAAAKQRREIAARARQEIWGEPWKDKVERVRVASPYSRYASWSLNAVMVKGGDDLRQELLASQIIEQFSAIFQEAGLPLWLKATKAEAVMRDQSRYITHTSKKDFGPLEFTGKIAGGLRMDLKRRLPLYASDWTDAFKAENIQKSVSSIMYLFIAALAPAITFGSRFLDGTNGQFGVLEMLGCRRGFKELCHRP
eukprot:s2770_g8.t2